MSAIDKATPRPWNVRELASWRIKTNARAIAAPFGDDECAVAWVPGWTEDDAENSGIASPDEALANAALIVRAVNSHALAEKMAEQAITFVKSVCTQQDDDDRWLVEAHKLNDAVYAFRKAASDANAVQP